MDEASVCVTLVTGWKRLKQVYMHDMKALKVSLMIIYIAQCSPSSRVDLGSMLPVYVLIEELLALLLIYAQSFITVNMFLFLFTTVLSYNQYAMHYGL